jgi:hypothetical protein
MDKKRVVFVMGSDVQLKPPPAPPPASMAKPTEEDRKRWAEADLEDERNGWGDTIRRIRTAFAER